MVTSIGSMLADFRACSGNRFACSEPHGCVGSEGMREPREENCR